MKKFVFIFLIFTMFSYVYSSNIEYKYTSSIPIEFVPLSKVENVEKLNEFLDKNNSLTVFCFDNDSIDENILYYLGIKKYLPSKIPDYGNYTYVNKNGVIVVYPKYSVYREDGALIFNPPKEENYSEYEFVKPYKIKVPNTSKVPNYDGYVLIENATFILYPKKYIIRGDEGEIYYIPPKESSDEYYCKYSYNLPVKYIPDYYDYVFVDNNGIFIIYPKKYVTRNDEGVLIFNPPVEVREVPIYKINYRKVADGVYEIKENKLLFMYPTSLNDKETLDIIGEYIAKNGGVFAYINKVPPYYKHILVSGVAVNKIIPDENGDYAIDVAGRKIKVDMLDDEIINKKLKYIKALKALDINVSYIVTGSEGIDIVEKSDVDVDELKDLYNYYWFKKWWQNYTHLYFNPSKLESIESEDILALSYYPLIYVDKAPETFRNDPIGGYYPQVISYKGTEDYGYWEEGAKSENIYYHLDYGEPYWDGKAKEPSKWYYEGEPVSMKDDSEMWDKYKYFNRWFVKNYAYALARGCDGLFLESSDKNLVDAIFGNDNEDLDWKLDLDGKVDYVVIPGHKGFEIYNGIPIIRIPTPLKEIYGVNVVNTLYIPPKDEDFGIYIADIRDYDRKLIIKLKENGTEVVSFKDLAKWLNKYTKNNIFYNGTAIRINDNNGIKITLFKKNFDMSNYTFEEFDKEHCKYVIVNPPKIIPLN
ncbi:hypothetical protein JH146_1324 [Methanocaldococcus bathoardescens]|uniref:Uncharacterized protein n=1 Tax=Methanocaldococcus bathoardescens TaxID=1301915 RepID=A0A076LD92_9EURY|nr:hypothetical protein [Methanocaldococcus bathoardescens]AIJ06166.1 hypothetical protein JH146_1324 [Methanocaldococcus bathoardescens]